MGMYTGIRFKGYVKEEFRKGFEDIALDGEWEDHLHPMFKTFGSDDRSSFIPCGSLSYMPRSWTEGDDIFGPASEGFEISWNEKTGYWTFQCSLKNYDSTIGKWMKMLPYFIEKIEHLEVIYEEWDYSKEYNFVDGEIAVVDHNFKYKYE